MNAKLDSIVPFIQPEISFKGDPGSLYKASLTVVPMDNYYNSSVLLRPFLKQEIKNDREEKTSNNCLEDVFFAGSFTKATLFGIHRNQQLGEEIVE